MIMSMTHDPQHTRPTGSGTSSAATVAVIISSAVVALGVFGGAVALALAGRDLAVILGLVGPVAAAAAVMIAALGKLVSLDRKQDEQTGKLAEVAHQTNGALKAHISATIRAEVRAALTDAGLPPANPPQAPSAGRKRTR